MKTFNQLTGPQKKAAAMKIESMVRDLLKSRMIETDRPVEPEYVRGLSMETAMDARYTDLGELIIEI